MKIDLKLLALIVGIGSLAFFLKHKPKEEKQLIEYTIIAPIEKSSKSITAKPLYSAPAQNYLGIGNNINSKR